MAVVAEQIKLEWEKLRCAEPRYEFTYATLYRAKVPGGWLLNVFYSTGHNDGGISTTFIPDPGHTWDGGSLP